MQQGGKAPFLIGFGRIQPHQTFDKNTMLGHRKPVFATGLAIPAADPRKPMGDIFNLDIKW